MHASEVVGRREGSIAMMANIPELVIAKCEGRFIYIYDIILLCMLIHKDLCARREKVISDPCSVE